MISSSANVKTRKDEPKITQSHKSVSNRTQIDKNLGDAQVKRSITVRYEPESDFMDDNYHPEVQ